MPFPYFIDNTQRDAFVACPLKWKRSFIDNLAPITPSIHLHAGGCFAAALETTRRAYYEDHKPEDHALALGLSRLIVGWGDPEFGSDEDKSLFRMIWAFDDYFREYPLHSDAVKPLMVDGRAAVEFTFAIPLPVNNPDSGDPLVYTGRFDMLGVFQDSIFVVDEKTSAMLGQSWGQQWDLKSQFTGYCAAAREYGYPVAGAIIRGVGLLKNSTTFQPVLQYRPDWQIDRWWIQMIRDVKRMVAAYTSGEYDAALSEPCSQYGGCAFRRLCLSPNPEAWIEGYFTERNWDPLGHH